MRGRSAVHLLPKQQGVKACLPKVGICRKRVAKLSFAHHFER
jgi:hypothetical protein